MLGAALTILGLLLLIAAGAVAGLSYLSVSSDVNQPDPQSPRGRPV